MKVLIFADKVVNLYLKTSYIFPQCSQLYWASLPHIMLESEDKKLRIIFHSNVGKDLHSVVMQRLFVCITAKFNWSRILATQFHVVHWKKISPTTLICFDKILPFWKGCKKKCNPVPDEEA